MRKKEGSVYQKWTSHQLEMQPQSIKMMGELVPFPQLNFLVALELDEHAT